MRSNFVRAWIRTEGVRSLSVSAGTTVADFAPNSAIFGCLAVGAARGDR